MELWNREKMQQERARARENPPQAPPNPNQNAAEDLAGLPPAAKKWLAEGNRREPNRSVASLRVHGDFVTIVSWPDFQKETFKI